MPFSESETIELKKSTTQLKEGIISIAAILNKHEVGKVYFGVKDDGTIIGMDINEKTIRDVSQTIADNIEPKIYPTIIKLEEEGKEIIEIVFEGRERPYFAYGRAYMRVGDEDRQLSARELEQLILKKNADKLRWESQPSIYGLDEVDEHLVVEFVRKANEAGRIDFKYKNVKETLTKLGLLEKGKLLRAAQVLFSDKNPIRVQAAVFAGIDKLTFLDIRQFEGNLFELLEKSEKYLIEKMNWRVKFGKLEREEIPEVPIKAIREALINSLCHRDYSAPEGNQIAVFKNRIEIYNPGKFPEGLTPEDFINDQAASVLTNPLIAEALFRTKDIERWASGLRRINDECKANDVQVEFIIKKTGFAVVFYRKEMSETEITKPVSTPPGGFGESSEKTTPKTTPKTTHKTKDLIMDLIRQNPEITKEELAKSLNLTSDGIKYNIRKLKKKGFVQWVGSSKGGHWEVVKSRGVV